MITKHAFSRSASIKYLSQQLRQPLLERLHVAQQPRVLHRLTEQTRVFHPLNRVVLLPLRSFLVSIALCQNKSSVKQYAVIEPATAPCSEPSSG